MRVILYAYEYHPLGGGVGKAVKEIVTRFDSYQDLFVDVVTSSTQNQTEIINLSENVRLHKIPIGKRSEDEFHKQRPQHMLFYTISAYFYTWKLILKNKYNLTHFFGYPGGVVSLLFRWKYPYIISLRGIDVPGYNEKFKKYDFFYRPLSKLIWRFATRVISNSLKLGLLAKETYPSLDIPVITNGVNSIDFKPVPESEKYLEFSVTASGTLMGKRKGLIYLVQGFAQLADKYQDVRLTLYAEGDEYENLQNEARRLNIFEKVRFTGRIPNSEIAQELPKHHVFCLPSFNEGMANVLLEGLASGLPLLYTDTGGSDEVIEDGVNGFIIPMGDSNAIGARLIQLYEDSDLRVSMGVRSREIADEMSWERVASEYYQTYKEVLN